MHDYKDITSVLEMVKASQDAELDMREAAREAESFVDKRDGQWEPGIITQMGNRPRYTFDKCGSVVDQVSGELDNNDYSLRVRPAGGEASKDNAKIYDGLIRNIRNISNADHIFSSAGRGMVTRGMDGWEVTQDYVDADAFEQDLFIKKIHNFVDRVWFDAASEEQDNSDANHVAVLSAMSLASFEEQFPKETAANVDEGRTDNNYFNKAESTIIGKFLYKKPIKIEIVQMTNGQVYKVDDKYESVVEELAAQGITEESRRVRDSHEVWSRLFSGTSWLTEPQKTVFTILPIVGIYGNYKVTENKRIYRGIIEKMMDAQRVYNYAASRLIEEGALAPRSKKWMTREQAQGHEKSLQTQNTNADPVQLYTHVDGQPQPYDTPGAQANTGLQQTAVQASEDLNAAAGLFSANMGDNPGLQSGVAIEQQISKGDNGTVKWFTSVEIGITRTGKILLDAIPKTYDSTRSIRVLAEDGSFEMQDINKQVMDEQTGQVVELNNLASGQYDVTCERGLSFSSRQKEAAAAFTEMAQIDPSIIETAKDVYYNNLDAPGMDLIGERAREQLLSAGMIPESQQTDEEKQKMAQIAQQQAENPAPDPMMIAAEAEMVKGEADMLSAQNDQQGLQIKQQEVQIKQQDSQVKMMEEQRKLQEMELDVAKLQQKQQEIDFTTEVDTHGASLKSKQQEIDIAEAQADIDLKKSKIASMKIADMKVKADAEQTQVETEAMKSGVIKLMKNVQQGMIGAVEPKQEKV